MADPTAGFEGPFFSAIPERSVVSITDHEGRPRDYTFPTFFADTRATMVLFTADATRCRALLGDAPFTPTRVGWNRCLFAIAAFHYGRLSDGMKGYHEWAFGVGVSTSAVPLLPVALRAWWTSFGVWVLDLPVDSLENCRRGTEIWGLPKTMKRFTREEAPGAEVLGLHDGEALACRLVVPRGGRTLLLQETNRALARKGPRFYRSDTRLYGECTQYTGLSPLAKGFSIEWGAMEPYRSFAALGLSARPLLVRHFESLSSALSAPVDITPP